MRKEEYCIRNDHESLKEEKSVSKGSFQSAKKMDTQSGDDVMNTRDVTKHKSQRTLDHPFTSRHKTN